MANKKILLTSVLKPVKDTRMYEKIGLALTKIDKAEIHIAGFSSNNDNPVKNIEFYPLFSFNRLNWKRLFAGWKIWQIQLKVKPEVIICNTHELLLVTVLYKILFGSRIVYDVQENYFRNLWFGDQFPVLIKHFIAPIVRVKEWALAPFFDSFLLAEKCYEEEMPFLRKKGVVIENKFKKPENFILPNQRSKSPLKLLYSGTISTSYGVFDCIELAKSLLKIQEGTFTIVGSSPDKKILKKVGEMVDKDENIHLIGDTQPVSHDLILDHISKSNLAIMAYKDNPALAGRIPTKIYEYISYKLPFISPQNFNWKSIPTYYNAWIPIDYNNYDPESILQIYLSTRFYQSYPINLNEMSFSGEEKKLLQLLDTVELSK